MKREAIRRRVMNESCKMDIIANNDSSWQNAKKRVLWFLVRCGWLCIYRGVFSHGGPRV